MKSILKSKLSKERGEIMNQEKEKKNKWGKFLAIALLFTMTTTGAITLAKYVFNSSTPSSTPVAKFSFSASVKQGGSTVSNLNLGSTVNKSTLVSGKIAPGTSGAFDIEIDATGTETDLAYAIQVENETNKPTNLKFNIEGEATKYDTLASLLSTLSGTILNTDVDKTVSKTIEWSWAYETTDGDADDTSDGVNANNYTFSIKISGTQVQ